MFLSRVIEKLGAKWPVIGFDTFGGFPPRRSPLDMYDHPGCVFTDLEAVRRYLDGRDIEIVPGDIAATCRRLEEEDLVLTFIDTDNYTPARRRSRWSGNGPFRAGRSSSTTSPAPAGSATPSGNGSPAAPSWTTPAGSTCTGPACSSAKARAGEAPARPPAAHLPPVLVLRLRTAAHVRPPHGGEPGPWTADPILREFKFCNVFRAADRVSQYMIRDVCYHDEPSSEEDRLFQITAFRPFSKTATWATVRSILGRSPTLDDLADGSFGAALDTARERNGGLYTGAFILCATDAYGQPSKHRNHVELFRHMFLHGRLGAKLLEAGSLREVYGLLHGYPLMGDFMSYQTTIDLNYSTLIDFSENEFTQAGPGALRGIKKCFEDPGDYTSAEIVLWMTNRQEQEFARLSLPFGGLWGRPLHAIDCQGLFCETDKYCREAAPELASARKRIKARFTPASQPLRLFFPPKWGINASLPAQPAYDDRTTARHSQEALF